MARQAQSRVRFVERLPPSGPHGTGIWVERLQPLLAHPGRWAEVYQAETPHRAGNIVQSLRIRRVRIPRPDESWSFAQRDLRVFARYDGPEEG